MTGHWIFILNEYKNNKYTGYDWHCSNCNTHSLVKNGFPTQELFYHNCGAEMTEKPTISIREINEDYPWEEF